MSSVDKVIFVGSPGVGRSVGSFSRLYKYSYDIFIFYLDLVCLDIQFH